MPGSFSVYARMIARQGQRDALIEQLQEMIKVGGTSGLESFSINAVLDDPDTIWVTETWADKLAHDTTTRSDIMVSAAQRVMSLLAEPPVSSYGHVAYLYEGRP